MAVAVATAGAAQAGRPLQTEDAGVLAAGACEAEGVAQRLRIGGVGAARGYGIGFNCGVGWRSQFGVGLSHARADGGAAGRGLAVGGKTGLWPAGGGDDDGAALTLAWGLGADRADGAWRGSGGFAALVASVPAGAAGTVHVNLSHQREREPRRALTGWNVAWEHEGFDIGGLALAPMAEVFGDDRGDAWGSVALRVTLIPERLFVDGSWGRQLRHERARLATVGFKLAF